MSHDLVRPISIGGRMLTGSEKQLLNIVRM
nr:MAG TPA: hypothetical protein [Caudoviricetes sp.]